MRQLKLTLPTTARNLAMDEWLLNECESASEPREVFRVWENPVNAVIIGRSSKLGEEVNQEYCRKQGIDIFRRSSGGASVVIGPGCLMYAAVLDYRLRPELRMLDQAHRFVMSKMKTAIEQCGIDVQYQGTCDLTIDGRKFSGNSLRCQRNSFLYHGTLLYDFDLDVLQSCLGTPPRQPDYRQRRSHREFVTNLPVVKQSLISTLIKAWGLYDDLNEQIDLDSINELANKKYSSNEWTYKR